MENTIENDIEDIVNNKNKINRKFSYKPKTFRLNDNAVKALNGIKKETNKSYNLIFLDLIYAYQKDKKTKR